MMFDVDDDDGEGELNWNTLRIMIMIDRSRTSHTSIYGWKSLDQYTPDDFDALIKSYRVCIDCNQYCWKDTNFCKDCYPFIMEYNEDCCCCLDTSLGVWYKLPCGHILHQRCYNKIEKHVRLDRKCPLCRAICEHNKWEIM